MRVLRLLLAGLALAAASAGAGLPPGEEPPALHAVGEEAPPILPPVEQLQSDAVKYAEAQAAALKGTYTFRVVKPPVLPRVQGGRLSFEPSHLSRRELGGMFFVVFRMFVDGRPLGQVRVDLEGRWTGQLLRTQTALPRKAVPVAGQVETVAFEGTPPAGALSEFPGGYRLRAPVPPGHILVMQDLEAIPVVVAGEQVRLEVVSGPLVIAVEALARSNGAVGDKIRLEMPSSHKNLQAVVSGPGEARVQWADSN
ncbi:MAG: flagellar basal body P-ring formation chaperone FlgA [Holophaga sp.]|jgi:flagella basal body P-ring formation protein FlgA